MPRKRRNYRRRKRLNLAAIPKKTGTPPTPCAAANLSVRIDREWADAEQFLPLPIPTDSIPLQVVAMGG